MSHTQFGNTIDPPQYRGHLRRSYLEDAERDNPHTVERTLVGQWQQRHTSVGGKGLLQQRRPAAERQRESITGWIGRYPIRKDADGNQTGEYREEGNHAQRKVQVRRVREHMNGADHLSTGTHDEPTQLYHPARAVCQETGKHGSTGGGMLQGIPPTLQ